MPKDKERSVNPAQAQRKAEKTKQLRKAKAEQQARRNDQLSRRNPQRVQQQIDDLKALEASGQIKPREKQILEGLERDLRAIYKAKEALGDKHANAGGNTGGSNARPTQPQQRQARRDGDNPNSVLGKRRYDGHRKRWEDDDISSGNETDESVRNIPMPKDTPPPMSNRHRNSRYHNQISTQDEATSSQAGQPHSLPNKPPPAAASTAEIKTTYSAAPQLRDLKKEATSRFVPTAVKRKLDATKGRGGLLEPEELDRLEREGYLSTNETQGRPQQQQQQQQQTSRVSNDVSSTIDMDDARRLAEEEARFEEELGLEAETNDDQHDIDKEKEKEKEEEEKEKEEEEEEEEEEEKEAGRNTYGSSTIKPQSSLSSVGGMFANLPKPNNSTTVTSGHATKRGEIGRQTASPPSPLHPQRPRNVEMEEVEDEDL